VSIIGIGEGYAWAAIHEMYVCWEAYFNVPVWLDLPQCDNVGFSGGLCADAQAQGQSWEEYVRRICAKEVDHETDDHGKLCTNLFVCNSLPKRT
jgi:hypothetical protein